MAEVAAASTSSTTGLPNSSGKMTVVDVLDEPVSDDEVIYIYRWLDSLEFSKSRKTSCNRDFADGVMMSELIALYIPKIINSTYCVPSYATSRKIANWDHLNKKVFRRIRFQLTPEIIKDLATARPGMIERVLRKLQPILFLGSKAVVAPSRKLENIKSRFMDFEKSYLKEVDKEKAKVEESMTSRPQSRQQSVSKNDGYRNRARTQSRAKGASTLHAPPPTATLELKVLKNPTPRSSRLPTKLPAIATKPESSSRPQSAVISKPSTEPPMITIHNPNDLGAHAGENYDIFTRPSTGKSSNEGVPSPSELLAEVTNLKSRMDQDAAQIEKDKLIDIIDIDEGDNLVEDSTLPELPVVRSSWLPVDDGDVPEKIQADGKQGDKAKGGAAVAALAEEEESSDTDSYSQVSEDNNQLDDINMKNQTGDKKQDGNNNPRSDTTGGKLPENREDPAAEQEADENVFCDQTGYDEDTEDGEDDAEATDGEDSDGDPETRPSREGRKKRKLKRVVKYEYREEYVLNGMAAFKLPNSAQLEKLKNDYINKGSKDPNCRGYGFV